LRVFCLVEKSFSIRIGKIIEVPDHGLPSLKGEYRFYQKEEPRRNEWVVLDRLACTE
jgi:hypothetical protein